MRTTSKTLHDETPASVEKPKYKRRTVCNTSLPVSSVPVAEEDPLTLTPSEHTFPHTCEAATPRIPSRRGLGGWGGWGRKGGMIEGLGPLEGGA